MASLSCICIHGQLTKYTLNCVKIKFLIRVAYKSNNRFRQSGTATSMPQHSVSVVQKLVCHNQSAKNITKQLSQCTYRLLVVAALSSICIHGRLPMYSLWQLDVCIYVCVYVCMYVCMYVCVYVHMCTCVFSQRQKCDLVTFTGPK